MSKKIIRQTDSRYEGKITYNKDTLYRLFRATDNVYHMRRIILRFLIGIVVAVLGAMASIPMILKVILMMAGCWLAASRDFSARNRVDVTLEKRKAALPEMTCTFYEEHIWLEGEGSMRIPYEKIDRLFFDPEYYFLFLSGESACMISRESLGEDKCSEFQKFVQEKTKKEWQEYKSFFQMNIQDLKLAFSKK